MVHLRVASVLRVAAFTAFVVPTFADCDTKCKQVRVAAFVEKWGPEGHNVLTSVEAPQFGVPQVTNAGAFASLFGIVGQITSAWTSIVSAFKSTYTEQIVEKDFNNGWSKFKAATQTFQGAGLAYAMSDEFFADIKGMIGLPSEYSSDFDQQLKWVKFFDNSTWSSHNTQFNIGKGGDDNSFSFFARNRQDDQKLDVLFLTCQQSFEKADNYFVISQSRSMLGGLWSKTKLKLKKVPAGMNDDDLKFVSEYFQLLAYQQIALASGASVPPDPSFPTQSLLV